MRTYYLTIIALAAGFLSFSAVATQVCKTESIRPTALTADFVDNRDGTVTHKRSGLIWMRCSLGQTWNGADCQGEPIKLLWREALQKVEEINAGGGYANHSDWRLPNIKELDSIAELQCYGPAINLEVFPGTPPYRFWSSSLSIRKNFRYSWFVYYQEAYTDDGRVGDPEYPEEFYKFAYFVRLVRGGAAADSFDKLRKNK